MEFEVRGASPDDSRAIGEVHVDAWRAAYRGIMPEEYLRSLRAADRTRMWRLLLDDSPAEREVLVAVADGAVGGFAAFGVEAAPHTRPLAGELYALNVSPRWWRSGMGRSLLDAAITRLAALGYGSAVLWVASSNRRARSFYESADWSCDGVVRHAEILGVEVEECRYVRSLQSDGDGAGPPR